MFLDLLVLGPHPLDKRDMERQQEDLWDKLRACTLCAEQFMATQSAHLPRPVFQGRPRARILIAGQAPVHGFIALVGRSLIRRGIVCVNGCRWRRIVFMIQITLPFYQWPFAFLAMMRKALIYRRLKYARRLGGVRSWTFSCPRVDPAYWRICAKMAFAECRFCA